MKASSGKTSWLDRLNPDIFGSDVFVHYQGTYVWQANQVGHFAIGFAAMSVIIWIASAITGGEPTDWVYILGALVVVLYAGKELIDLLIARHQAQDFYAYDKAELFYDMAADTWFVAAGVLTALAAYAHPLAGIAMAAVFVGSFLLIGRWFLPAKESLDRAALPYVFRLANFPKSKGVNPHNADRIRAFVTGRRVNGFDPPPAILIQGYRGTGKSTLGIGIASEAAVSRSPSTGAHGRSLYFTAFGLFEREAAAERQKDEGEKAEDRKDETPGTHVVQRRKPRLLGAGDPWSVDDAEVLVIDDVDSDNPLYCGGTPEQVLAHMRQRPEIFDLVKTRKSVWITGTTRFKDEQDPRSWIAWEDTIAALYGLKPDRNRIGTAPADIQAQEPIPVIWLREPLNVEAV